MSDEFTIYEDAPCYVTVVEQSINLTLVESTESIELTEIIESTTVLTVTDAEPTILPEIGLIGPKGNDGNAGPPGAPGSGSTQEWVWLLVGDTAFTLPTTVNFVDVDCSEHDVVVTLADPNAMATQSVKLNRLVGGGSHVITIKAPNNDVLGILDTDGNSLEVTANGAHGAAFWRVT